MILYAEDCKDFAAQGKRVVVTVDGHQVKHVTIASEDGGWVERIAVNSKGNYVIAADGESVEKYIQRGIVRVQIMSAH